MGRKNKDIKDLSNDTKFPRLHLCHYFHIKHDGVFFPGNESDNFKNKTLNCFDAKRNLGTENFEQLGQLYRTKDEYLDFVVALKRKFCKTMKDEEALLKRCKSLEMSGNL